VLLRIGNGTGLTNYPDGHNVLVSFFSNSLEVDTRLSVVENKALNLSSTNSTNNTTVTGNVSVINSTAILDTPLHNVDAVQTSLLPAVGGSSYGFKFTITQPISIIRQGIYIYHWLVTTPNVVIKFWSDTDTVTPLFTGALSQSTTWPPTSFLYGSFGSSPLLLQAGTYRVSIGYRTGMFYNGPSTAPFTFGNEIKNVQACSSTSPDGAFPNIIGTSNITAGGFIWYDTPAYGSNIDVSTLNGSAIVAQSSIDALNTKTQYQSIVGLITSFTNGLRINGPVYLNGASILDVASINRPYFGLQYQHNSTGVPTVQSSSLISAFGSTALSASPWVKTNNYTRQYGCGLWTTGGLADGAPCGYGGTVGTGAYVTMDLGSTFGLSYSLAIADSAYNSNNCQNFFGLWNLQNVIPLNQTTQLSVQRNMLCFGSDTDDPNICIYSGGPSTTVKWVDLGGYFPSNIEASGALTNFFKFCLYWDGTTVYYRADNTTFPDSVVGAHITGQFTPLPSQIPTASCTNQCVRIMGTPQSNGQAKLKVQRFGVF
jgi:hypothetical protein